METPIFKGVLQCNIYLIHFTSYPDFVGPAIVLFWCDVFRAPPSYWCHKAVLSIYTQ